MTKKIIVNLMFLITFVSVLNIISASDVIPLYDCNVLDIGGGIYELQNDIINSETCFETEHSYKTCFKIKANNVILDMNGHSITGKINELNFTYAVYIDGYNNTIIKNGYIYGFYYGIYLKNNQNNKILSMTINNTCNEGIYLGKSSNNILRDITSNSNEDIGITFDASSNNDLINIQTNNNHYGIWLWGSSNNVFTNITTNFNKVGIRLEEDSSGNTIKSSYVENNEREGIRITDSSNNVFTIITTNITTNFNEVEIRLEGDSSGNIIETDRIKKICSHLGIECGLTFVSEINKQIDCGGCGISSVCIHKECYNLNDLGNCIGNAMQSCEEFGSYSCELVGCEWNEESLSCDGTPKPCSELKQGCLYQAGCEWEKSEIYTKKYMTRFYWIEKEEDLGADDFFSGIVGTRVITLEDFKKIENEEISLLMVMENSFLPVGTEVVFEIYKTIYFKSYLEKEPVEIGIRIGDNAIPSIVDENGNAIAEWIITMEDLDIAEYEGHDRIDFRVIVNGTDFNRMDIDRRTELGLGISRYNLLLSSKKGDCIGTIPCEILPLDACKYASDCNWNNEKDSCEGTGSLSCTIIEDEETCNMYNCTWNKYGFWGKFVSWFKNLFRNLFRF